MTAPTFEEWLKWFDSSMRGRKVALLMDNFSAHEAAIRNLNENGTPLRNTLVINLPPNATSRYQPLDQGIIKAWKAHWKRQWVRFLVDEFDNGRDPMKTMDLLKAIQWASQAWQVDVGGDTIRNCFRKALWSEDNQPENVQPLVDEISEALRELELSSKIAEPMDVEAFLDPSDELVRDKLEDLDEMIFTVFLIFTSWRPCNSKLISQSTYITFFPPYFDILSRFTRSFVLLAYIFAMASPVASNFESDAHTDSLQNQETASQLDIASAENSELGSDVSSVQEMSSSGTDSSSDIDSHSDDASPFDALETRSWSSFNDLFKDINETARKIGFCISKERSCNPDRNGQYRRVNLECGEEKSKPRQSTGKRDVRSRGKDCP
ncbi:hypothetical protein VTN31DRAFT_7077 [Thermomyces dupontii]|uniref:uncharacterized protein n=1 Tax=Talaromyces thermophilus TaxID=28565 RepID=UPI0037442E89